MATDFIIVRHGDPAESGVEDPGLSELGQRQVRATAAQLAGNGHGGGYAALYTSPLLRAARSAEPIAEALGLEPVVEERVAEFDFGRVYYSEKHAAEMDADTTKSTLDAMQAPDFRQRVLAGFDAIEAAHPDREVIVVSHGGVISTLVSAAVFNPELVFLPEHGSVTRVRSHGGGLRNLVSYNEASWLAGLDRPAGPGSAAGRG